VFQKNENQQMSITDSFNQLPEYLKDYLRKSWAHEFQNTIFPAINEERFSVIYSDKPSRPNTPINVIIGGLLIKELQNLTDEELVAQIHLNDQYQYALRLTSEERPQVSANTFGNFRKRVTKYYEETGIDLIQEEIEDLADVIVEELEIDDEMARVDSFMLASSCRKLSRIELVYRVNEQFIKMLDENFQELIPEHYKDYLTEDHENEIIYRTKNSEAKTKLENLLTQSKELFEIGKDAGSSVTDTEEFKLLERMLKEQTKDDDDNSDNVEPKDNEDIASDSLQNTSDPDATFRIKYEDNVGYVANVLEQFDDTCSVIKSYDLKPNIYSDQKFSRDTLEKIVDDDNIDTNFDSDTQKDDSNFLKLLMDGTYYTFELAQKALSFCIKFIPGDLTGKKPAQDKMTYFENFTLDEEREKILSCAGGYEPVYQEKQDDKDRIYAVFAKKPCRLCKLKDQCRVNLNNKQNSVSFTEKRYEIGRLRQKMGTQEYKELANKRAGIEGIPSVLRRKYDIDYMPVRGVVAQKLFLGFKIGAINFKKLLKGRKTKGTC